MLLGVGVAKKFSYSEFHRFPRHIFVNGVVGRTFSFCILCREFSALEISPGTRENTSASFSESQVGWLVIFRQKEESYV